MAEIKSKFLGTYVTEEISGHLSLYVVAKGTTRSEVLAELVSEKLKSSPSVWELTHEIALKYFHEWSLLSQSRGTRAPSWFDYLYGVQQNLRRRKVPEGYIDRISQWLDKAHQGEKIDDAKNSISQK